MTGARLHARWSNYSVSQKFYWISVVFLWIGPFVRNAWLWIVSWTTRAIIYVSIISDYWFCFQPASLLRLILILTEYINCCKKINIKVTTWAGFYFTNIRICNLVKIAAAIARLQAMLAGRAARRCIALPGPDSLYTPAIVDVKRCCSLGTDHWSLEWSW